MRNISSIILCSLVMLLSTSCNRSLGGPQKLSRMLIIDQNGVSETISDPKRLKKYQATAFEGHQPYQKVIRYFEGKGPGDKVAIGSTYYPNGQIHQYLEGKNSRAFGAYRQWYPHGQLKVEAHVIAGVLDFQDQAAETWIFDGPSTVYSEEGNVIAKINYSKGLLQGTQETYDECNVLIKRECYDQGVLYGLRETFYLSSDPKSIERYLKGQKNEQALYYWPDGTMQAQEEWKNGKLITADYYSITGEELATVKAGFGKKAHFEKGKLAYLYEVKEGFLEGLVEKYNPEGLVIERYHIAEGAKYGQHTIYYEGTDQPKLQIPWQNNTISGLVKTWYRDGTLESQKEYQDGKKSGLHSVWYSNGRLMMVEDYSRGNLTRGEYFSHKTGQKLSQVIKGDGEATLCNPQGQVVKRIDYKNGQPQVNE